MLRPPNPGNITNDTTNLQPLPSGQHFMKPPKPEDIYQNYLKQNHISPRNRSVTSKIDLTLMNTKPKTPITRRQYPEGDLKPNNVKIKPMNQKKVDENSRSLKPVFINCSHPVSKCHCRKRSISQEKLESQASYFIQTKSVNSIQSANSIENMVKKSKENLKIKMSPRTQVKRWNLKNVNILNLL